MNILHMKYAVEVAKVGSLNKAAETLLIAAPNISRSIKDLEAEISNLELKRLVAKKALDTYTKSKEDFILFKPNIITHL